MYYLYVQIVTRQCFCFRNSQWGVTAHDNFFSIKDLAERCKQQESRWTNGYRAHFLSRGLGFNQQRWKHWAVFP